MSKDKINVAIIDTGINKQLLDIDLLHNIEINHSLFVESKLDSEDITDIHGTLCASIVKKYATNVNISSIKILNNYKGNINQLYSALNWCIKHNINVINLSLGSIDFHDFDGISKIVNKIINKGIIMICASSNDDYITYPAALSNVIGVRCDKKNLLSEGEYFFEPNIYDGIDIIAFSKHILNDIFKEPIICENSNSFAAPLITSIVCNILNTNRNYSIDDIKKQLSLQSKNYLCKKKFNILYRKPDWIQNAIIFSNKKDINSKAPYFFNVIEKIIISDKDIYKIITNKMIYYNNIIDTIIINLEVQSDSIFKISNLAEIYKKNIVWINEKKINVSEYKVCDSIRIWHKDLIWNEIIHTDINIEIKTIDVPIILIYFPKGMDMMYFLYKLKKYFFDNNYNAFVASDYTQAILYNIEYIPLTYIMYDFEKISNYLRNITYKSNSDIIIFGVDSNEKCKLQNINLQLEIDIKLDKEKNEIQFIVKNNQDYIYLNYNLDTKYINYIFKYIVNILST